MPRYYPAFIDVRGRDCVVIGGGDLGEEKVVKLLECDAGVIVISAEVTDRVRELAEDGAVEWIRRDYEYGDLERAFIAIANTGDDATDRVISREAEERNVLLNVVDVTPSMHLHSSVRRAARRGDRGDFHRRRESRPGANFQRKARSQPHPGIRGPRPAPVRRARRTQAPQPARLSRSLADLHNRRTSLHGAVGPRGRGARKVALRPAVRRRTFGIA